MSSIFYHTQRSFAQRIFQNLGKGAQHAKRLYSHFTKTGSIDSFQVEPQAKDLVDQIIELTDFSYPAFRIACEQGTTRKIIIELEDSLEVEAVLIPMKTKTTLCISSQVGCKMGCAFCQTGKMGRLRHLTTREIVAQVFIAKHCMGASIDNLVFMGMGEPLDNFEALLCATRVLTDDSGLAIAPSHITISTSGLVDQIDKMSEQFHPAIRLAVSVNAPNDAIRSKIMPVNKQWDMAALRGAMERFCQKRGQEIFIEYVLLQGVNDSVECADQLASYLQGLDVKVNLIPYNPQKPDRFAPPTQETIDAFSHHMQKKGYLTFVRQEKGSEMMAACGQLGNMKLRPLAKKLQLI